MLTTLQSDTMTTFIHFLKSRSAIALTDEKLYLVQFRLTPLARRNGFNQLEDFVRFVNHSQNPILHQQVIEAMTTHETFFFRDEAFFETLRQRVLPELLARPNHNQQLNMWCGACSSGQEPYSVLMLLKEHFPQVLNSSFKFMATDISSQMIDRSKSATYSEVEISRGLNERHLNTYFEKHKYAWKVKDDITGIPQFSILNLIHDWPHMPPMDIIFLRNVLIYFDAETKSRILERVSKILKPGGYLFLGTAESTLNLSPHFERHSVGKTEYSRLKTTPLAQVAMRC